MHRPTFSRLAGFCRTLGACLVLSNLLTAQARAKNHSGGTDTTTIDGVIEALYDVISGPAGEPREWHRFRSLFHPTARLSPTRPLPGGRATLRHLSPDEFVEQVGQHFVRDGFFEIEIGRQTVRFGNVAHAFSAYATRRTAADPRPFQRGINSIQLLKDGSRWWIVSIMWDSERPENPIPVEYLEAMGTR